MNTNTSQLLNPYKLNDLELANRVAMAPMTRARAGESRVANSLMAKYYAQRADTGLLITEATTISPQANGWVQSPGIYTDQMTDGWKQVVDAVHKKNGKIFMQLWHCGRASHSSFHHGNPPVAPSAIKMNQEYVHTPKGKETPETPRALETDEIPGIVEDYRNASESAKKAGFDGVEIHAANGYLVDEFLQAKTNHRTDQYGGSKENRYRFLDEIVKAVMQIWPSNRVGVRISPNGVFNDMGSEDYHEQFAYVAEQLNQYHLAYLHVMDGLGFGFHELGEAMTLRDLRKVFNGPLMGNCGYDLQTATAAVADGHADMIAIGRPFISNPDLIRRYQEGLALNPEADVKDWYSPTGSTGYTDFPILAESETS
ncbi:MAG: alkene reductase [Verrucomicrobiota bacterium]